MHQCNQRKQLVERPKSLLCSIACKPATVCLEQTVRGVIIPTLPFYLKILWFFFNVSASSAAVNLSQMWYPGSPCGSSTKCLGTVTLQSSCRRHWLNTSCNLMHTQGRGEGTRLRTSRGTGLARSLCHSLQPERFATADCFVALPLNWTNFKREREKRRRDGLTVSILSWAELILLE